jgi:hypothetical protein
VYIYYITTLYFAQTLLEVLSASPLEESSTLIPLSFKGEGERKRRGTDTPLKHPVFLV